MTKRDRIKTMTAFRKIIRTLNQEREKIYQLALKSSELPDSDAAFDFFFNGFGTAKSVIEDN